MRRLLLLVGRLGQLALWALLLGFLALVAIPRFTPFDVLVVRGGSMEPAIHLGSVVIVDRGARVPTIGSIMAFREAGTGIVTHRVVGLDGGRYVTQGDANRTADTARRTTDEVYGSAVVSIPFAGFAIHAFQQPVAFLVLLLGTGGLLVVGAIRTIAAEVARMRGQGRTADADRP